MSSIDKIRQEVENSIKAFEFNGGIYDSFEAGELSAYKEILDFIDSLPEEKPSYPGDPGNPGEPGISDLEEAAEEYERENRQSILSSVDIVDAFIAGAEWQREQDATQRK
jgi:hypothetical protein